MALLPMQAVQDENRISQIRPHMTGMPIAVRVLNKWKPFNTKEVKTYLLIDKHGDVIQAMIEPDEEIFLDEKIEVMKCYILNEFKVSYAPTFNKVAVHAAALKVDRNTRADLLPPDISIPTTYFNFLPYDKLSPRADNHHYLTDYIARVEEIEYVETQLNNSLLRLKLMDTSGNLIVAALWKEIHSSLNLEALSAANHDVIIALTALKVISYLGRIQLQSTSGTKFSIDPDIPAAKEMSERFKANKNELSIKQTAFSVSYAVLISRILIHAYMCTISIFSSICSFDGWCMRVKS